MPVEQEIAPDIQITCQVDCGDGGASLVLMGAIVVIAAAGGLLLTRWRHMPLVGLVALATLFLVWAAQGDLRASDLAHVDWIGPLQVYGALVFIAGTAHAVRRAILLIALRSTSVS